MKSIQGWGLCALFAFVAHAHAAAYNVTGAMTDFSVEFFTIPASLVATFDQYPTIAGQWNVDTAAPSLAASFREGAFHLHYDLYHAAFPGGFVGSSDQVQVFRDWSFDTTGATSVYDDAARTLTISGGTLRITAQDFTCVNATGAVICVSPSDAPPPTDARGNDSTITLAFSPDLATFTGTLIYASIGSSVQTTVTWAFNGTQVPVPAAAWLFGSGLLAAAGLRRARRRIP